MKSYDTYAFFSPENFLRCNRGRALTLFGMHYVVIDCVQLPETQATMRNLNL